MIYKHRKLNNLHRKVPQGRFRGLFVFFLFFQLQSIFAIEPFNFALITDIHISADTTSVADLKNCVYQINNTKNIDFVLIAGDMTEKGDLISLQKSKEILDNLKIKYFTVPGNHETLLLPNGKDDFISIFGDDKFIFEHKKITFLGINTSPKKGEYQGNITTYDLKWLKKQLKKIGRKKPIFIVTHYPPIKGEVKNIDKISEILCKYNVTAILTGHYHRNAIFSLNNIPIIVNRSNLRGKQKLGAYTQYEIDKNILTISEHPINDELTIWAEITIK